MLDYLVHFITRIGSWSYLAIFLGASLESAIFLGFVIPGETLALVAGFLAAQGALELDVAILSVSLGAIVGDSIGYEVGQRLGRPALSRYGSRFGLSNDRIKKADEFFARHGNKAVFLGRFVSFGRAMVPFLAGASRMPYRIFLPYNVFGGVIWASIVVLLGYGTGASWQVAARWIGRASEFLAGILVFFLLLFLLYRWAAHHEATIRDKWESFLLNPAIRRFRQRFAPQIAFIQDRLDPKSYLGLRLTLGALVLIGASWLFGGIAEDVLTGDPLTVVDVQVANWFHARTTPITTQIMLVVSHLNGTLAISTYILLAALYLSWRRDWYWLICLMVTMPTGMLLNVLMKYAFHRDRPSFEHPILSLTSYSFPSGHAANSTLFFGLLAAFLVSKISPWKWRVTIVFSALALAFFVSLSRLYLGVHYLSDVLAGMAEAVAWLSLSLDGIHTYWEHRAATEAVRNERRTE
jgi:membrane protein DedA with SNARE-associated domain/membrane-associated phospholipid phosphatase